MRSEKKYVSHSCLYIALKPQKKGTYLYGNTTFDNQFTLTIFSKNYIVLCFNAECQVDMIVSLTFSKTCDYVTKIKDVSTAYDFRHQHNEVHVEVKNCQYDFHFKTPDC